MRNKKADDKPLKGQKRSLDEDEAAESTDTQDLDMIPPSKKRTPTKVWHTPSRKSVIHVSTESPLIVRGDFEDS